METLSELLEQRAKDHPELPAYVFLKSDGSELLRMTYGELREAARAYGAAFQAEIPDGGNVLLILPDEHVFLPVCWGCFYAGIVAVPAPAMDVSSAARMVPRLRKILDDAESRFILTTRAVRDAMLEKLGNDRLDGTRWILVDELKLSAPASPQPRLTADSVAILQYTSGSTSSPKGILLTHANVMNNFRIVDAFMALYYPESDGRVCVTWLPYFHDMGLIGTMLQAIYSRYTTIVMKPLDFLQRPVRWLRTISKYRAVIVTAPNFAYEICVKKATDADVQELDLSSLKIVMNGAETVRLESLKRFASKFARSGFRLDAFVPVYGLAENTLFVAGVPPGEITSRSVTLRSLEGRKPEFVEDGAPKSVRIVSCGRCEGQLLRIVDPVSGVEVPPGEIGEIWVSGGSVARGYWKLPEETERTFGATLASEPGRTFLRTGDLGFLLDGHLYFSGRIKDLIIVHGKNHYPQDIELTAEQAHPLVRPGCLAAFSVEDGEEARVVLVAEAKARAGSSEVAQVRDAILRAISQTHGLALQELVLIPPGTIFKTSSGKVQRQLTKRMWAKNTLIRLDSIALVRFWSKLKLIRYFKANASM